MIEATLYIGGFILAGWALLVVYVGFASFLLGREQRAYMKKLNSGRLFEQLRIRKIQSEPVEKGSGSLRAA